MSMSCHRLAVVPLFSALLLLLSAPLAAAAEEAAAPPAAGPAPAQLISPEAQAKKQDPSVWGDFSVLALNRLNSADRQLFASLPLGAATLPPDRLGRAFPEPHPSWTVRLEQEWQRRYGR